VLKNHAPNSEEAKNSDEPDNRSSLDRLADFTRRIVAVPKEEIATRKPAKKKKRRA
jgi:hypothetical protein